MLKAAGLADIMPMIFVGLAPLWKLNLTERPHRRMKMIKTDGLPLAGRVQSQGKPKTLGWLPSLLILSHVSFENQ